MSALEITIQQTHWHDAVLRERPVVVGVLRLPGQLPRRVRCRLGLTPDRLAALARLVDRPVAYGQLLGRALFCRALCDLLTAGQEAAGHQPLHVQLVVEDARLQALFWEWLCVPAGGDGRWLPLARLDALPFARALPNPAGHRFIPRRRDRQRALLVLANPPPAQQARFPGFDETALIADLRDALGEIPCDVLGSSEEALAPATLRNLESRLRVGRYTLLYVAAHGSFNPRSGTAALLLLNEQGELDPVPHGPLLDALAGVADLPHCIFLAACESAGRSAATADAGLAQRLVEVLGIPAVVAMVQQVSMGTAGRLAGRFFRALREHGYPDCALTTARSGVAGRRDELVPALFSRLEDRSLFAIQEEESLTPAEIERGLRALRQKMGTHAPAHLELLTLPAEHLRAYAAEERAADPEAAVRWLHARAAVEQLATTVAGVSFRRLALAPPADRSPPVCPFPGAAPLAGTAPGDCYGREGALRQLLAALEESPRLILSGRSGCGKTSLLQAGLLPRLGDRPVHLTTPTSPLPPLDAAAGPLLIVDQMEQLWTAADGPQHGDYAQMLLGLPAGVQLLLTVDESFLHCWQADPALAPLLQADRLTLAPLADHHLREIMERQVTATGLRLEEGLALRLAADLSGEAGGPALLQRLLAALWERRYGPWLRQVDYDALGGVDGVVTGMADALWQAQGIILAPLRRALPRLAHCTGDWSRATGRWLDREDLAVGTLTPADTARLLHRLTSARLLVAALDPDRATARVTVAHEALLRRWPRFQQWLAEDGAFLQRWEPLYEQLCAWRAASRSPDALPRGAALAEQAALVDGQRDALTGTEVAFLATARAAAAAAAARRQAALRSGTAVRGFLAGGLAYGAATALGLSMADIPGPAFFIFAALNQALYGGFAALAVFLLLDPTLLEAVERPTGSDMLRAGLGAGLPLAALLVAETLLGKNLDWEAIATATVALGAGLLAGGLLGSGLLWRAVGNRPVWILLPLALACGGLIAAADGTLDILPLHTGPWYLLWIAESLLPLALILSAGWPARRRQRT